MIPTSTSEGHCCPPLKRNGALAIRASGTHAWVPQKVVDDPTAFRSKGFWACPCNDKGRPTGRPFWAVVREVPADGLMVVSNWRRDLIPCGKVV